MVRVGPTLIITSGSVEATEPAVDSKIKFAKLQPELSRAVRALKIWQEINSREEVSGLTQFVNWLKLCWSFRKHSALIGVERYDLGNFNWNASGHIHSSLKQTRMVKLKQRSHQLEKQFHKWKIFIPASFLIAMRIPQKSLSPLVCWAVAANVLILQLWLSTIERFPSHISTLQFFVLALSDEKWKSMMENVQAESFKRSINFARSVWRERKEANCWAHKHTIIKSVNIFSRPLSLSTAHSLCKQQQQLLCNLTT